MLGWVNYLKGQDYYSNSKFYLKKANEVCNFEKKLFTFIKIELFFNEFKAWSENKLSAKVFGRGVEESCGRAA
jgi:hypothetical protein